MPHTKRQKKKNENKVYFADWEPDELEGDILPLTKVGVSSNPERRVDEYTLPPFGVQIVAILRPEKGKVKQCIAQNIEQQLHSAFSELGYKVNGEWFSLPDEVIGWAERKTEVDTKDIENAGWR